MIVEVKLSPEAAEALKAKYERGELGPLGVKSIVDVAAPHEEGLDDDPPAGRRPWLPRLMGWTSLACASMEFLPVWSPLEFVAGIAIAVAGLVLAIKSKARYVLPMIGLAANCSALAAWPMAIGFFPSEGGYRFGRGDRSASRPRHYMMVVMVSPYRPPGPFAVVGRNESAMVYVDGKLALHSNGYAAGITLTNNAIPGVTPGLVPLTESLHHIDHRWSSRRSVGRTPRKTAATLRTVMFRRAFEST